MSIWQNIFYNKSIRRLRQMLEAVRMRDYTLRYKLDNLHGEERKMAEEINNVIADFRELEHSRVRESHFYDAMFETIDSMMIATDDDFNIKWMNKAAINDLCGFKIDHLDKLSVISPELCKEMKALSKGGSCLVSIPEDNGEVHQLVVSMCLFFSQGITYHLYSIQRVDNILQQVEVISQQKLIRVLTHEIMNSLSPIISLSGSLLDSFEPSNPRMAMSREEQLASLSAINRRAEGLLHFVESYKKVSGLPEPFLTRVSVIDLINKIGGLLEAEIRSGIKFNILCPDITISVDRGQIEQVIINLLKNAHEAGATITELMVTLANKGSWLVITVTDNGCGFLPEAEERLFTPFFSTKQKGEGVGLSICKQIITNHGGTIKAKVREDASGSIFTVRLPL